MKIKVLNHNFNINRIEWDRFDEDRWILASITSLIVLILTFIFLSKIKIPESPEKVIPPEIIEFVPEVKKKKIVVKKPKDIPEPPKEEEIIKENPEIALELFKSVHDKVPLFPEDMPISNELRKFQEESSELTRSSALTEIPLGVLDELTENVSMDYIQGLPSVSDNQSVNAMTINPNPSRDADYKISKGLSTRIIAAEEEISDDFSGFSGDISWEDWIDPIMEWIKNHPVEIYEVAKLQMNVEKNDNTSKVIIKSGKKRYELLLASKPGKRQLTICLINIENNSYTMLIDQGLKKTSNYFNIGKVKKDQKEVVEFTGETKPASDPKAEEFTKIFWQWATKVTKKG